MYNVEGFKKYMIEHKLSSYSAYISGLNSIEKRYDKSLDINLNDLEGK